MAASALQPSGSIRALKRFKQANGANAAAQVAEWSSQQWVWVKAEKGGYVMGRVTGDQGDQRTVALKESGTSAQYPKHEVFEVNPPTYDGVEDIADLSYLSEASVVHNLKFRYQASQLYTYSGLFLVAVNPYRALPIYSAEVVAQYQNKRRDENAPHVFAVAERAYQNLVQDKQSQSVLVTGESGAGKTENTKKVIQYLAAIAASPLSSSSSYDLLTSRGSTMSSRRTGSEVTGKQLGRLERQILQANPILEAFGNAQTVKNDNSSRFGKFVRIFFNAAGSIAGANISWYLLEKSRVTGRSTKERNFHVFYQLLAGADDRMLAKLLLPSRDPTEYGFLKGSATTIRGVDDKAEWETLLDALRIVGFTDREQMALFKVVAAILLLGNIVIDGAEGRQATISSENMDTLERACTLLGVRSATLKNALLRPKSKAGGEVFELSRDKSQVDSEIGAMSKTLYERLFGAMVDKINAALDNPGSGLDFIGVLDIAGFEIFEENSFEQLCINFTNERLQQFFNHHMFVLEQEEYAAEGIEWSYINFGHELEPTIKLIASSAPVGILSLLDEASIMPKATDRSFTEKMHDIVNTHDEAVRSKYSAVKVRNGFRVRHYAGEVEYNTDGWLNKNKDPLHANITDLLARSDDTPVASLFSDFRDDDASSGGSRIRKPKGAFRTVAQTHKEQLSALMTQLHATQPHFVRCIVPNRAKQPGVMDVPLVLEQLRCNGVLEGIRIARRGYPNRLLFSEFYRRFQLLTRAVVVDQVPGKGACEAMLRSLALDKDSFRIGITKVFFKAGIVAELEERRDETLAALVTGFQAAARGFMARRTANKTLRRAEALFTLQQNARQYNLLHAFPLWDVFQQVRPLLPAARSEDEARRKDTELAAAREAAEKAAVEQERLETQRRELETARVKMEERLRAEQALMQEKDVLLERSKAHESELEDAARKMESEVDELRAQLQAVREGLRTSEQARDTLKESVEQLQATTLDLRNQQARRERELASQTSVKTQEWEKTVADRDSYLAQLGSTRSELKQVREDKERDTARLTDTNTRLSRRLEAREKESSEHAAKVATLEVDLRKARDEATSSRRELQDAKLAVSEKATEEAKLRQELDRVRKDRDGSASREADLRSTLSERDGQLSGHKRELSELRITRKKAEEESVSLKSLLDVKMSAHDEQAKRNKINEQNLEGMRTQLQKITADYSSLQQTSSAAADQARRSNDGLTKDVADLRTSLADVTNVLDSTRSRLAKAEAERNDLESKQNAHELEVELIRTKSAEESLQEREKCDRDMAAITAKFQALEDRATTAEREKEGLEDSLAATKLRLEQVEATSASREAERKALAASVAHQDNLLKEWAALSVNLRAEIQELRSNGELKIVEHVRVHEEAQRLQNLQMQRIEKEEADRRAHLRTVESALQSTIRHSEDLQAQLDRMRRERFQANKPVVDTTADRAIAALEKERKLREEHELTIKRLQHELERKKADLDSVSGRLEGIQRSHTNLEQELNSIAASDHAETLTRPPPRSTTTTRMVDLRGNGPSSPMRINTHRSTSSLSRIENVPAGPATPPRPPSRADKAPQDPPSSPARVLSNAQNHQGLFRVATPTGGAPPRSGMGGTQSPVGRRYE